MKHLGRCALTRRSQNGLAPSVRPAAKHELLYQYTDPFYNIPIVLKRAAPELDEKELLRFKQEYDVLKSLSSPYVIEVYSYDYPYNYINNSIVTIQSKTLQDIKPTDNNITQCLCFVKTF